MHTYADTDELVFDKLSDKTSPDERASVARMNEAVSEWIDVFCKRPKGYFLPAAATATPRRYRGRGRRVLQIGKHVAGSISVSGVAPGLFYESESGNLYRTNDSDVWREDQTFIVTARWGYEITPAPIIEAVKQIVARWQSQGNGILGQVTINGFFIERDAPPSAKSLLLSYVKNEYEPN